MIPDNLKGDSTHKKVKMIIDHFGHAWFQKKQILDLGALHGDIGAAFWRLGANVVLADARVEHLKVATKKYPGIQTCQVDLDKDFPFKRFDMVLCLGLLCHLKNFENLLRSACASASYLVVETAVCDSDNPNVCSLLPDNKDVTDWSYNGFSSRPSSAMIERIFTECQMKFKRFDVANLNVGSVVYDWQSANNNSCDNNKRRFWIACKDTVELAIPIPPAVAPAPINPQNAFGRTPRRVNNQLTTSFIPDPRIAAQFIPKNIVTQYQQPNKVPNSWSPHKRFVVVIPSYNNLRWCKKNITSALDQNYPHYRIIFTDDCSSDGTFDSVSEVVNASPKKDIVKMIRNDVRKGALNNLFDMIHSCEDDEIILTLDGDDWFPHGDVLNKLHAVYSSDVWMTYGQYRNHPDGGNGVAQPYQRQVIQANGFRSATWGASHLRTFYAWLFKKISVNDLMMQGEFFKMTWDFAIMLPQLEMAGYHSQFIGDQLYVYNMENPINDHKVDVRTQQSLDRYIRGMPKYQPLASAPPPPKPNIGLLIIATNKYHKFVQGFISSADRYFLKDIGNITYYVFSDTNSSITANHSVVQIPIEHRPFPYASMDRYKHFTQQVNKFAKEDFLFYADVDTMLVDNIGTEILGDLVAVRHAGFYNRLGPYETNPQSTACVDQSKCKYYFGGGFQGGRQKNFLEAAKWCYEALEKDVGNGIIPVWHDESIWNKYCSEHDPSIILSPAYHYPQSDIERYKKIWFPDTFNPKILLLDKDHGSIRS